MFLMIMMSTLPAIASAGSDSGVIGSLNGESVSEVELRFWMDQCRSEVTRYFFRNYGVTGDPDFWKPTTIYGTETPLEKLKSLGLQRLIHARVQLQLAKQEGLIPDSSFIGIMKQRIPENARRLSALKSNKVIYGPKQYDEHVFFDYFFSNLLIQLKGLIKPTLADSNNYESYIEDLVEKAELQLFPAYYQMTVY